MHWLIKPLLSSGSKLRFISPPPYYWGLFLTNSGLRVKQYDFALKAILRALCKAIPSQLALSSFELLSLKTPIFERRRYE